MMLIVSGNSEECRRERYSPSHDSHCHILINLINPLRQVVINLSNSPVEMVNPPIKLVESVVDMITQGDEWILRGRGVCHRVLLQVRTSDSTSEKMRSKC